MNEGIRKFRELLLTDETFRQKLKEAGEAYTGEQSQEGFFNGVLLPLGQEYGISATFGEFKAFVEHAADQELDADELAQLAGGTKGAGATLCFLLGIGAGVSEDEEEMGSLCAAVGFGAGGAACMGSGASL